MSKVYRAYLLKYLPSISRSLRGKKKDVRKKKNLITGVIAKGMETEILLIQIELQNLETTDPRKYLSDVPTASSCQTPNLACIDS